MSEQWIKGEKITTPLRIYWRIQGNAHIADESNPPAQETPAEEIIGGESLESPKKAEI